MEQYSWKAQLLLVTFKLALPRWAGRVYFQLLMNWGTTLFPEDLPRFGKHPSSDHPHSFMSALINLSFREWHVFDSFSGFWNVAPALVFNHFSPCPRCRRLKLLANICSHEKEPLSRVTRIDRNHCAPTINFCEPARPPNLGFILHHQCPSPVSPVLR
jgi:hypothetical protein